MIRPYGTIKFPDSKCEKKFVIPTIAANTSREEELVIPERCTLKNLHITCSSTNYNLTLKDRLTPINNGMAVVFTVSKIYKSYGITGEDNERFNPNEFNAYFTNNDAPQKSVIYALVVNNDVVETGPIYISLLIEE